MVDYDSVFRVVNLISGLRPKASARAAALQYQKLCRTSHMVYNDYELWRNPPRYHTTIRHQEAIALGEQHPEDAENISISHSTSCRPMGGANCRGSPQTHGVNKINFRLLAILAPSPLRKPRASLLIRFCRFCAATEGWEIFDVFGIQAPDDPNLI